VCVCVLECGVNGCVGEWLCVYVVVCGGGVCVSLCVFERVYVSMCATAKTTLDVLPVSPL